MVTSGYGTTAPELLALEQVDARTFRNRHNLDNGRGGAIFGGQPMAQALVAARRTLTQDWPAHSYSAHFLRAGDPALPVDYAVEPTRDGRRFASRRVLAQQDGKAIFDMLCAFHDAEDGPVHDATTPPAMPDAETLEPVSCFIAANAHRLPAAMVEVYGAHFPIELRLADPETVFFDAPHEATRAYWLRVPSAAGIDDPADHQAILAFLSDYWLAGTAGALHFRPSGLDGVAVVTLNHSLWFHRPARTDDWLLYASDSPWAGDGRGLARGTLYDRSGALIATTMQEVSMRRV